MAQTLAGKPHDPVPEADMDWSLLFSWPVVSIAAALALCSGLGTLWQSHQRTAAANQQIATLPFRVGGILSLRHGAWEQQQRLLGSDPPTEAKVTQDKILKGEVEARNKALEADIKNARQEAEKLASDSVKSVEEWKSSYAQWQRGVPELTSTISKLYEVGKAVEPVASSARTAPLITSADVAKLRQQLIRDFVNDTEKLVRETVTTQASILAQWAKDGQTAKKDIEMADIANAESAVSIAKTKLREAEDKVTQAQAGIKGAVTAEQAKLDKP